MAYRSSYTCARRQNLRASIDFGLSPAEVQRRGRWHDQLSNVTLVDVTNDKLGVQGFSNRTTAFLTARGYNITYGAVPANGPRATLSPRTPWPD
jgi:hypothetical protein